MIALANMRFDPAEDARLNGWRPDELAIVEENYPKGGVALCRRLLPKRSPAAIRMRASTMGVRYLGRHLWTDEEQQIVRTHYPVGGWRACRDLLPRRTYHAVQAYAHNLGLRVAGSRRHHG